MKIFKIAGVSGEQMAKRMMKLAWDACGGPTGMGVLKDRGQVSEDAVWKNVCSQGDYAGARHKEPNGSAYADPVFGRMMKLNIYFDANGVKGDGTPYRRDYQAFAMKYKQIDDLVIAAAESLGAEIL